MRILQVITLSELGGAQSVVVTLSNLLSNEHEVIVAAGKGDGKMWMMLNPKIRKEYCKHLQREVSLINDILALIELRKIYNKYKPDIIHLHSSKAGLLGRLVYPSKKIVYTVHGFDSIRLAHRQFLPIERVMQFFCRAIVGVSRYDKKNLIAEKITNNVYAISNGILKINTSNLLTLQAFSSGKKTILCIARVSPPKRIDLFIEIAKALPQYQFVWIGNQEELDSFDIPGNCCLVGNIPNAGAYCSLADMFILTSDYEGLPMVIIEAMSFGKPIVSSDVGAVNEIVRNGENGYVLPNEVEKFTEKICEILENKNIYNLFCKNSFRIFNEGLKADRMVSEYVKLYKRIMHE